MDNIINNEKYYSNSLETILEKYITFDKYGIFNDAIKEIFQRRAYAFDFSNEEMENQIINFIKNVEKIDVVNQDNNRKLGFYSPSEKSIKINESVWGEETDKRPFNNDFFMTFTHEMYHAISDKDGVVGLNYYNPAFSVWKGKALDEVFVESASKYANEKSGMQITKDNEGYDDITFVTELLSNAIGVEEKEVLKSGIQDRKTLESLIASRFPDKSTADYAIQNMFETFEASLDIIYNLKYSSYENLNEDLKNQMLATSLTNLYTSSLKMMQFQIAKDKRPFSAEYSEELSNRYSKIREIMQNSMQDFKLPRSMENNIIREASEPIDWVQDQILGIREITDKGSLISPQDYEDVTNSARKGRLYEKKMILASAGIDNPYVRDRSRDEVPVDICYENYMKKNLKEKRIEANNEEGR